MRLIVIVVAAVLAAVAVCADAGGFELSSSAITFYNSDFRKIYFDVPACELYLQRAFEKSGGRRCANSFVGLNPNASLLGGVCGML